MNNTTLRILKILAERGAVTDMRVVEILWPESKQPEKKRACAQTNLRFLVESGYATHSKRGGSWVITNAGANVAAKASQMNRPPMLRIAR